MRAQQAIELQALTAIQAFIVANEFRFARIAASVTRTQFDKAIYDAHRHAESQRHSASEAKALTREINILRTDLVRDHIAIILDIARLKLCRNNELVRMKTPRTSANHHALADTVRAIVHHAKPVANVLIEACLPDNFIERLETACCSMIQCVDDRRLCQSRVAEATRGLQVSLGVARRAASLLGVLIRSTSRSDPGLRLEWNHFEPQRKKAARSTQAG